MWHRIELNDATVKSHRIESQEESNSITSLTPSVNVGLQPVGIYNNWTYPLFPVGT